jgi:Homeodomain-like domain
MPRAVPLATRQEIVRRHRQGQTLLRIAADLHLPLATVRDLGRAFRDHGEDGLVIRYHACGQSTPGHPRAVLHRACPLERWHPTRGAGRVRVELLGWLDAASVPSPRTLQRAFQREGVNRPRRPQRPHTPRVRPEAPHDLWEVDAVEKKRLQTGEEVSWMAAVDVYSGALLAGELPPPSPMANHSAQRRPGLVPPRLLAVGPAADDPSRQRPSLGLEPDVSL